MGVGQKEERRRERNKTEERRRLLMSHELTGHVFLHSNSGRESEGRPKDV